ncbi:MAG: GTP-binding protein [Eubacteriales bacterium]|nr:GTP-binding protein [Eubacteriales bacterium]
MTKVDLITGFLGAGKTTFLRFYLNWLKGRGQRVHIIENEFGSAAVDAMLLAADTSEISDLSGCCMCCTGKATFIQMLLQAGRDGYDRILVEPSGVYDVDEFFSVMADPEVASVCEIGSIITIVEANRQQGISKDVEYLMFSQLLAAGRILMSKTQYETAEEIRSTTERLQSIMAERGESLPSDRILIKEWEQFTDTDYEQISGAGYHMVDHVRDTFMHEEVFGTVMTANVCVSEADLEERLQKLFASDTYGTVLRIKGHIRDLQGQWYEVNCTPGNRNIRKVEIKRGLLVLIGMDLDEKRIMEEAFLPKPQKNRGS